MLATAAATDRWQTFRAGSASHCAVIVVVAVVAATMAVIRSRQRDQPSSRAGTTLDRAFAVVAAVAWLFINARQLLGGDFARGTVLPLHVSDLTELAVPFALWMSWRWARAVVYYWGLALGSLAFIIPDLHDGPGRIGFWLFWSGHTIIMTAIVYDLFGRGYRPAWRDWAIVAAISLAYAALVIPFNAVTGDSYGYLGPDRPGQPALLALFGPWPMRVVPIVVAGIAGMAVLTLPWTLLARQNRRLHATAE
jgi:hypothetical integral membrane protein (TIGR02206 family)